MTALPVTAFLRPRSIHPVQILMEIGLRAGVTAARISSSMVNSGTKVSLLAMAARMRRAAVGSNKAPILTGGIMKRILAAAGTLALAAGLIGGLATTASASVRPPHPLTIGSPPAWPQPYCVSWFFTKCATIQITGATINTAPGYYPTVAGPVINVSATAVFSRAGVQVTDFRLLVDRKLAPEYDTWFGSGSVGVIYGTYNVVGLGSDSYNSSELIPGTVFPVAPGRHSLTVEVIGVNGAVLATSPSYTVTVPKQAAAVRPKLTYTAPGQATYEGYESIDIHSAIAVTLDAPSTVLIFTVPTGVTITENQFWSPSSPGVSQSGNVVTLTDPYSPVMINAQNPFSWQFGYVATPIAVSSVALDGVPVSQG